MLCTSGIWKHLTKSCTNDFFSEKKVCTSFFKNWRRPLMLCFGRTMREYISIRNVLTKQLKKSTKFYTRTVYLWRYALHRHLIYRNNNAPPRCFLVQCNKDGFSPKVEWIPSRNSIADVRGWYEEQRWKLACGSQNVRKMLLNNIQNKISGTYPYYYSIHVSIDFKISWEQLFVVVRRTDIVQSLFLSKFNSFKST